MRLISIKLEFTTSTTEILLWVAHNALVTELMEQCREKLVVLLLQLVQVKKNIYVCVKLILHISDGLSLILVED